MDERDLEMWAQKHRKLARQARRERTVAIAAAIGIVVALLLVYLATQHHRSAGPIGPLLF